MADTPLGNPSTADDVDVAAQSGPPLDVSGATVTVTDDGSFAVSTDLSPALASNAGDELRVSSPNPLDVSASTVTVTDNGSFSVTSSDGSSTDTTTSGSTNVAVSHADGPVGIVADTSGAAVLTVEVSHDGGGTWTTYTVDIADSNGLYEEVHGFEDVRASVDTNLNRLTISAKGVGG